MTNLQGQFLIATPKLVEGNFAQSVVLMVRHGEDGALGLIVNRPLETKIQNIWEQVSDLPCLAEGNLYQGGPCEGPLMVLHTDPEQSQAEVREGVHFTTDKEMIEQLVVQNADELKFFVGYSGWAVGQLEAEIAEGAWLTFPSTVNEIFSAEEELWESLYKRARRAVVFPWIDPKLIPEDPTVN